jgi:hypothetical protein
MQISIISGLLKALKSRICNESRNLINVQILICDVKLQKWDAPKKLAFCVDQIILHLSISKLSIINLG